MPFPSSRFRRPFSRPAHQQGRRSKLRYSSGPAGQPVSNVHRNSSRFNQQQRSMPPLTNLHEEHRLAVLEPPAGHGCRAAFEACKHTDAQAASAVVAAGRTCWLNSGLKLVVPLLTCQVGVDGLEVCVALAGGCGWPALGPALDACAEWGPTAVLRFTDSACTAGACAASRSKTNKHTSSTPETQPACPPPLTHRLRLLPVLAVGGAALAAHGRRACSTGRRLAAGGRGSTAAVRGAVVAHRSSRRCQCSRWLPSPPRRTCFRGVVQPVHFSGGLRLPARRQLRQRPPGAPVAAAAAGRRPPTAAR